MKYIVVLITTPQTEEATKIANKLVEDKIAACVNIIPHIHSIFWWENKIDKSAESLLIIKTRKSLLKKLITMVKKVHSYTVPEIIALPIIGGNEDYLRWLNESVKKGK
ncbi:MAG: divalent-cation tolerance protein CutA [bacterium]